MECLENVIGLTQTQCPCFSDEFQQESKTSTSGRYMDELPEFPVDLRDIKASLPLCGSIESQMLQARKNAIAAFKEALFRGMSARFSQSVEPYVGLIGGSGYTKNLPLYTTYAGIELQAKAMFGATMLINRIDTYFAQSAAFNILIYSNDALIETIPVNAVANNREANIIDPTVSLPLTDANGTPYKYKIVYATAGLTPKDITIGCGCGHESKLDKFFTRKGIGYNTISSVTHSSYTHGLSLSVNIMCGSDDLVCDAYNNDPFFRETAAASIQRKSVEFLIVDILSSKNINREVMTGREQMAANRAILHNKFKNDVQWLSENMKQPKGGCFKCAPADKTISVGGIRF